MGKKTAGYVTWFDGKRKQMPVPVVMPFASFLDSFALTISINPVSKSP